jgi:pyruvate dehydrogenase E2 component (dihydrolipoamide acetyltransferase)
MIVKADLEAYSASGRVDFKTAERADSTAGSGVQGESVALTSHQRAVAHNLARSSMEAPHFYLKCSLICDRIASYREKHRDPQGGKLAVDAFFLFAVAKALKALPRLNGYYRNDSFVPRNSVDINIAVSAGEELYAPVLKNVQGRSIEQIDNALRKLAAKTREHRLEGDDMQQGSFTVTNLGMYPVDEFAAIINPPQSGILSIGRMRRELVIGSGDTMQIHTICTMTGSFDHRIVNGTQGGAFMQHIQEILEGLDIP